MNRLVQWFNQHEPGSFRLCIGMKTQDPAAKDEDIWCAAFDPATGEAALECTAINSLDFQAGYNVMEFTPEWRYWMKYGYLKVVTGSGYELTPFVSLTSQFTEDEIKGFMMQCLVRRSKVYRTPDYSNAVPLPGATPEPKIKDVKGERLS